MPPGAHWNAAKYAVGRENLAVRAVHRAMPARVIGVGQDKHAVGWSYNIDGQATRRFGITYHGAAESAPQGGDIIIAAFFNGPVAQHGGGTAQNAETRKRLGNFYPAVFRLDVYPITGSQRQRRIWFAFDSLK